METIIIGLGNPIRADDGLGIKAVREIAKQTKRFQITEAYTGGISLMEKMVGYQRAVIIDAMHSGKYPPGYICRLSLDEAFRYRNLLSSHDCPLNTALEIGRSAGLKLPTEIVIWAVEVSDLDSYSEELTPDVAKALPQVVELVLEELNQGHTNEEVSD